MRNTLPRNNSAGKNGVKPRRVGMHVLGPANSDVRVMREAITLKQAGFVVSIVDVEKKATHPTEEEVQGIHLKHILMADEFFLSRFKRLALFRAASILIKATIYLVRTPVDIYHAHDVSGLLPCYIAAWMRRKPLIFDSHELPLADMSIRSPQILFLLSLILKHIVPRCAGVMTVSSPIAQLIRKRYRCLEVSLLRNIPLYASVPKSDLLRQHLGLRKDTQIALFQGNLTEDRGLDLLIKAAKFLEPNIVIVLMGKDKEGRVSQLLAQAAQEDVSEKIKIVPPAPYSELLSWTASADIGLIIYRPNNSLNIKFCLPNKFFEYLMAGLPIIVSQLDAIEEMINTYDVGRVVPLLTPEAIAETINTTLKDRIACEHMHSNALIFSKKELCWENEKHTLIRLYQKVLGVSQSQDVSALEYASSK